MTTEIRRATRRVAGATIGALLALGTSPAWAATHYAAPNGNAGNWPCATSASPCDLKTAIQGNGASHPASGDQVVIENTGTAYSLSNAEIIAPVSEEINGATGQAAPQIDDAFASGSTPEAVSALTLQGGTLTHVDIRVTQTGTDQNTAAATSDGGTVFDDDIFASSSSVPSAQAVWLSPGDKLLDSVAYATGSEADGVFLGGNPGATFVLRNVTAYATGTNADALFARDLAGSPCQSQQMSISIRNVIAEAPGAPLSGMQYCPGDEVNFDIDYSDYNPTQATLPTGLMSTPGSHNINAAAAFANPASYDFSELTGSPTIDKGTDDPQDGVTDPDGRGRFLGAAPDIGAYEFPAAGAVTGDATDVTGTDGRMNGTVDSEGTNTPVTWAFQYGTSPSLGTTVTGGTAPGSHTIPSPDAVNDLLTGLQPGTTYYYRVRASNANGETFGATKTFTTNPNVKIVFAGTGRGVVNSSPNLGGCGESCTYSPEAGATYTVTATADSGSAFSGWSGAGCTGTQPCALSVTTNATLTATFTKKGQPTISGLKLTGVAKDKPKLRFSVTQGTSAPEIKRLQIKIAGGFTFGKLHHAIHVNDKLARARVANGELNIKLPVAVHRLKLTLIKPAITVLNAKHHRLKLTVTVKDAEGTATELIRKVK